MKILRPTLLNFAGEMKAMLPETNSQSRSVLARVRLYAVALAVLVVFSVGGRVDAAVVNQKGFSTPDEAVKALIASVKSNNVQEMLAILGPEAKEVIASGDPVTDKVRLEKFIAKYDAKNSLSTAGDKAELVIGEQDWPFPIPLVKNGEQWVFDTAAGKEEILNRRIGENELATIQTMLAIVDAQREYAMKDRDGNSLLEYASKFRSDPGKKNGLFWETKEGEEPSPMGELVASAKAEGYSPDARNKSPQPYQGYYFRMLNKQGKNAAGGAFAYSVQGKQIGGFAVIAYPATYGNSGVMTFVVNHDGLVLQKDLGPGTKKTVKAITTFDPDTSWKKAE
jgi:hypothetical protein